jgi:DNA-directed RNA polymerase subunit RPC12/RpoP
LSKSVAQKEKRRQTVELDLTKIDGNGDFPCPTCGINISPEDESEDIYVILEEKVIDDVLEEMVIQCNNCSSKIRLTGFVTLEADNSKKK